jgi:phosphopantetheinyl transferase
MRMNRVILAYSRLPRQLPAGVLAHWCARLSPTGAARLRKDRRAQLQSVLGMALACRLLSGASGRQVGPDELRYTPHGKPHASGLPQFSIAHAGDWVICALSSDGAIGIDIEPMAPRAALPSWTMVFDGAERRAAYSARAGLTIWTTKEATLKAAGGTLAELASVRVRGRRVEFRGHHWHVRAPRVAPRMITRLITEWPVTQLLLNGVPAAVALGI